MIKRIKSVPIKCRNYRVNNFLRETLIPQNMVVKKDCVLDGCGLKKTNYKAPTESQIVKMYKVENRIFCLCEDGMLYESKTNRCEYICEVYNIDASMLSITVNSESDIIVAKDDGVFSLNGNAGFDDFPVSNCITYYNGRYFIADYNNIYITELYNMKTLSSNFKIGAQIWLDETSGKVLGFCPCENYVIVVCEKAVYKIVFEKEKENYKIQKMNYGCVNAVDRTFSFENGVCVFINNGKLTKLVGDNLVEKDSVLDGITYTNAGIAKFENGKYYYPITIAEKGKFVFVYDFSSDAQTLFSLKDDGFAWGDMVVQDGLIYTISDKVYCKNERNLVFKPIDFDDCDYKTLSGVGVNISGQASLKITGDFGVKTYPLKAGYNSLVLNLISKVFTVEIVTLARSNLYDLTLEYRLKGE